MNFKIECGQLHICPHLREIFEKGRTAHLFLGTIKIALL